MEDRKQNQGQGPGGAARQKQDEAHQNFQGGGRTGTPVRPQSKSGQQQNQQQDTPGQSTGKEGESRRGADWDASRGESGKTAAGEDTRPL